jgi:hypothetical protein
MLAALIVRRSEPSQRQQPNLVVANRATTLEMGSWVLKISR